MATAGRWATATGASAFREACREQGVVERVHPLPSAARGHHGNTTSSCGRRRTPSPSIPGWTTWDRSPQMQPTARNKLRKSERRASGHESRDLGRFHDLYQETMQRADADEAYCSTASYFAGLDRLGDRLSDAGRRLCGSALHLRWRRDALPPLREHRRGASRRGDEPSALGGDAARPRARPAPLHLGGGLRAGDALATFKQSVGAGRAPYVQGRAVHDPEAYPALLPGGGRSEQEVFPPTGSGRRRMTPQARIR